MELQIFEPPAERDKAPRFGILIPHRQLARCRPIWGRFIVTGTVQTRPGGLVVSGTIQTYPRTSNMILLLGAPVVTVPFRPIQIFLLLLALFRPIYETPILKGTFQILLGVPEVTVIFEPIY
jgi:hypothetical protein